MSVGFGFSVGDIITSLVFIKQATEALHDTKGAAADYQALIQEVDSLIDGLEAIQDLKLDQKLGSTSRQSIAIENAVSRCRRCVDEFLVTIVTYQPWLRTNIPSVSAWKVNVKKIQWALCRKEDVREFRRQLERHSSSINMLLVTLQVNLSITQPQIQDESLQVVRSANMATIDLQSKTARNMKLLKELSLEQRQIFQNLMDANERMAHDLRQMWSTVQVHLEIPPQVHLQKPVTLLDACGKFSAFHLDFINSTEAFLAVLKIRFQKEGVRPLGIRMLDESKFILRDHKGILDLSKPWEKVFRPNQRVNMSMTFRWNIAPSNCPACNFENQASSAHENSTKETEW